MTNTALILLDYGKQSATATELALAQEAEALAVAGLVNRVATADDNEAATDAIKALDGFLKLIETARTSAKRPIIDIGRAIEAVADRLKAKAQGEKLRIGRLQGDYGTLLLARKRAEEAAAKAELTRIEREREAALAKAQSHDEREAIQEKANVEVALVPAAAPVVKADGQSFEEVWKIDQIDSFVLMKARPDLVRNVDFDLIAVKAALKAGLTLPGVKAHKETVSKVRGGKALELAV